MLVYRCLGQTRGESHGSPRAGVSAGGTVPFPAILRARPTFVMSQSLAEFSSWLSEEARELARARNVVGFAVAIYHRGEQQSFWTGLANREENTPVTAKTLFRLSSITKSYTAAVVMQLRDEGLLNIDQPIAEYLSEARASRIQEWHHGTARHLLSHTSGADEYDIRGKSGVTFLEEALGVPFLFPPGAEFSVSNFGYILLGQLVEMCGDACWYDAMRSRILEPLGFMDTTISLPAADEDRFVCGHVTQAGRNFVVPRLAGHLGPLSAAGGLYASVTDLLQFGLSCMNRREPPPVHLDTLQEMHTAHFEIGEPLLGDSVGLGWFIYDRGGLQMLSGSGHGFGSVAELRLIPAEDFALAFLANSSFSEAGPLFWHLASLAYRRLLKIDSAEPPEPRTAGAFSAGPDLAAYAGIYRSLWGEVTVTTAEPGLLLLDVSRFENGYFDGQVRLRRLSPTVFAVADSPYHVTFPGPTTSCVPFVRVGFHVLRRV
jgi:CubicO group peptidase (beta-lactamase class C family)